MERDMTTDWDNMWSKPFDDGAHYATRHLVDEPPLPDLLEPIPAETFLDGKVTLHSGDCLAVLPTLAENSIDACVTDPPYHLTSIVKRFSSTSAERELFAVNNDHTGYRSLSGGFMGKAWDGGDIAFRPDVWREIYRVLKPGAHLVAFGGTRTYHRMACAIEDAGFEIRDCIMWVYGSGFPKSHDVSKAIDRAAGAEREVVGRNPNWRDPERNADHHARWNNAVVTGDVSLPATDAAAQWEGWGTALKPAVEPIVLARKPLSEGTVAANVLRWGTGAINVDGCRVGTEKRVPGSPKKAAASTHTVSLPGYDGGSGYDPNVGRWPANLVHDGSEEVVAGFPETQSGSLNPLHQHGRAGDSQHEGWDRPAHRGYKILKEYGNDSGSASRFFYTAKADADDRLGSKHPTVKPVDLMQWLVRLVTPKGGTVLDQFAGTGTTGEAAWREGFSAVLIEAEPEYQADIRRRMALALAGPVERKHATVKARGQVDHDPGPLFSERKIMP